MNESNYMRPALLEAIARNALKKYDPSLLASPEPVSVPIEYMIEASGLSLEYQYIRKNGRILGETVFDDDYIPLYNMEQHKYELVYVVHDTIILDASLLQCRTDGRLRFTAAHEFAHWLLHRELYSKASAASACKSVSRSSDEDNYIERQADTLAGALLMPINQVKRAFYRLSGTDKVAVLAKIFNVSRQAMEIRLKGHNLI